MTKKDEIYELPLFVPIEKTLRETKDILDRFFSNEDSIVSLCESYEFADYGLTFTVQYYGKDEKKLVKLIKESEIELDKERYYDMLD